MLRIARRLIMTNREHYLQPHHARWIIALLILALILITVSGSVWLQTHVVAAQQHTAALTTTPTPLPPTGRRWYWFYSQWNQPGR